MVNAILLALLQFASASPVDLNIEKNKLVLEDETVIASATRKHKDYLSVGIAQSSLNKLSVQTGSQSSRYDIGGGIFADYATPLNNSNSFVLYFNGRVSYFREEQYEQKFSSALHMVPISLSLTGRLERFLVKPLIFAGAQGVYLSQQGSRAVKTTEFETMSVLGLGLSYLTPWNWGMEFKISEVLDLDTTRSWQGTEYSIGFVTSI